MSKSIEVKLECPVCKFRRIVDAYLGQIISIVCPNCKTIMKELHEFDKERSDILNEAHDIINGGRQDSYGNPEDSFKIIAEFWSIYLKNAGKISVETQPPLTSLDVAHMMSLFKHARMLGQKPARDNYTDACGYLAIAANRLLKKQTN